MSYTLLIIDMLEDFFTSGRLEKHRDILTRNINELTAVCHQENVPVIWVKQEYESDLSDAPLGMKNHQTPMVTIIGTPGAQILSELQKDNNDYEIIKKRFSAFFKTNLESLLQQLNPTTLIIAGINTHACVRMAAIDAYERDYKVILATDCIDSFDEKHHQISLNYLTQVISQAKTNKEIATLLVENKVT